MKQRGCNSVLLSKLSTDVASSFAPGARYPSAALRTASRSRFARRVSSGQRRTDERNRQFMQPRSVVVDAGTRSDSKEALANRFESRSGVADVCVLCAMPSLSHDGHGAWWSVIAERVPECRTVAAARMFDAQNGRSHKGSAQGRRQAKRLGRILVDGRRSFISLRFCSLRFCWALSYRTASEVTRYSSAFADSHKVFAHFRKRRPDS